MTRAQWAALTLVVGGALLWFALGGDPIDSRAPAPADAEPASRRAAAGDTNNGGAGAAEPNPDHATEAKAAPSPATPAPAPSEEQAAPPAPQASSKPAPGVPTPERSGPLDELERLFGSEPRDSNASSVEAIAGAPFRRPEVPAGLLKSVICRRTVCRVETHWSPDRAAGFMSALMRLVADPSGQPGAFDHNLAISPQGEPAPDGSRDVDIYMRRSSAAPAP